MSAAARAGAFLPLGRGADDLGIRVDVAWILADSIRTLVAVRLEGPEEDLQVSRAWLTDDRGGAHPLLGLLELSPAGAAEAGAPEHRSVLVFGSIPPEATRLRLEIQRLEPAAPGLSPCERVLDPWQPMGEDDALHVMAWEKPDDPMRPVPLGTLEGCWAFEVEHSSAPAWAASSCVELDDLVLLGTARLRLLRLQGGLTGWRLSSRIEEAEPPPPQEDQRAWVRESGGPEEVLQRLEEEGLSPLEHPFGLRLALRSADEVVRCDERSGPWGPLGDRFYDFFPPTPEPPVSLLVDQVLGLALDEPWVYEFHPKKLDDPRTPVVFPHGPFPFRAEIWADGLFWQEEFMLLAPRVAVQPGPVAEAWAARCRVSDLDGNTYDCQGQAWATLPQGGGQLYGLQFPPLHRMMERARLEVESVDLLLADPLEVPCQGR